MPLSLLRLKAILALTALGMLPVSANADWYFPSDQSPLTVNDDNVAMLSLFDIIEPHQTTHLLPPAFNIALESSRSSQLNLGESDLQGHETDIVAEFAISPTSGLQELVDQQVAAHSRSRFLNHSSMPMVGNSRRPLNRVGLITVSHKTVLPKKAVKIVVPIQQEMAFSNATLLTDGVEPENNPISSGIDYGQSRLGSMTGKGMFLMLMMVAGIIRLFRFRIR